MWVFVTTVTSGSAAPGAGSGGRADGSFRLKGAWVRLGHKSCDGERLKSSTVMDVVLLCGHPWLGGEGWGWLQHPALVR